MDVLEHPECMPPDPPLSSISASSALHIKLLMIVVADSQHTYAVYRYSR